MRKAQQRALRWIAVALAALMLLPILTGIFVDFYY